MTTQDPGHRGNSQQHQQQRQTILKAGSQQQAIEQLVAAKAEQGNDGEPGQGRACFCLAGSKAEAVMTNKTDAKRQDKSRHIGRQRCQRFTGSCLD